MYPFFSKSCHNAYPWSNKDIYSYSYISVMTVHSAVEFDEMSSQGDSYSTPSSPGQTPEAAVIWPVSAGLQQAFHISCWLPCPFPVKIHEAGAYWPSTTNTSSKSVPNCCRGHFQLLQEHFWPQHHWPKRSQLWGCTGSPTSTQNKSRKWLQRA